MSKKNKEHPIHPLGEVPIKIARAYFAKDKLGQARSTMLLAQIHGTGKAPDGAEVMFTAVATTVQISFKYEGDSSDDREQQRYEFDIGDLVEAAHELNKKRRAMKFTDAPSLELP